MKEHPPAEILMHIQASANEIIAINLAISYFFRSCRHISPVYEEASQLLAQFQRRITEQLPEIRH